MADCFDRTGYLLDPHGAVGYRALKQLLLPGEVGVFMETAHPAKFKDTVESMVNTTVEMPARLYAFMRGTRQTIPMTSEFSDFKSYLRVC